MKKIVIAAALIACMPGVAAAQSFGLPSGGNKNGFTSDTSITTTTTAEQTQGRSGKPAQTNNNQGTATDTTTTTTVVAESGPKGVLKNDNTTNPNYDQTVTTTSTTQETNAPGNSKPR